MQNTIERIRQTNAVKEKDKLPKIEGQLRNKNIPGQIQSLETGDLCLQVTKRKETQA